MDKVFAGFTIFMGLSCFSFRFVSAWAIGIGVPLFVGLGIFTLLVVLLFENGGYLGIATRKRTVFCSVLICLPRLYLCVFDREKWRPEISVPSFSISVRRCFLPSNERLAFFLVPFLAASLFSCRVVALW